MSVSFSFPVECACTAKASRCCELTCISEVAASLVGTWEGAGEQAEYRALPCAPSDAQR